MLQVGVTVAYASLRRIQMIKPGRSWHGSELSSLSFSPQRARCTERDSSSYHNNFAFQRMLRTRTIDDLGPYSKRNRNEDQKAATSSLVYGEKMAVDWNLFVDLCEPAN